MEIIEKAGKLIIARAGKMLYLSGVIDIDANFDVLKKQPDNPLLMSLKGIERVNSHGILNLLRFVNSLGDRKFELHECPVDIVELINMVPSILGPSENPSGRIKSFYAIYSCPSCDKDMSLLCRPEEFSVDDQGRVQGPLRVCGEKVELEMDDDVAEFITLLQGTKVKTQMAG